MITGIVTADHEATIRLELRGPAGRSQVVDAVIDTGFDGWLSLPPSRIAPLGLPWRSRGRALLADGSESIFEIYEGTVIWDGQPRRVSVDESDLMPLVGMAMLADCELTIEVRPLGRVTIRALP